MLFQFHAEGSILNFTLQKRVYKIIFLLLLVFNSADAQTFQQLNDSVDFYYNKGLYNKAIIFSEQAKLAAQQEFGVYSRDYASSLNTLAVLYYYTSNYAKAEPLYAEALNIRKKVLGSEHPDYAYSLSNLANMYESLGNYDKAEPLYAEALNIRKKVLGTEHPDYAINLGSLARLYDNMGNYNKAEPLYVEAMNIQKKVLGTEHPDYATSLNNLAFLYSNVGNYSKAEPLYVEAMTIWKKIGGAEHPYYASSLNNLGNLYERMGNYDKAESLLLEALNIRKKVLGAEHPYYASSLNNLAVFYISIGNFAKGELLLVEVRNILKKVLGVEHPNYASSLNNLAYLYQSMGNYAKAEPLLLEALNIRKKVLGSEHPDYATNLNNLGNLYERMINYAKAEIVYVEAMNIWKKTLKLEHPGYANILGNLAFLYDKSGNYNKAESLHLEALNIRKKALGSEHPDYATSLNNLAVLYHRIGKYVQAESLFTEAMTIFKKVLGEEHPNYAKNLNNLAGLYQSIGNYSKAEPLFIKSSALSFGHLLINFANLSESEKQNLLDNSGDINDLTLSFQYIYKNITPSTAQFIFNQQLQFKSLILTDSRWLMEAIQKSNDSVILKTYENWLSIKKSLSRQFGLPLNQRSPELTAWEEQAEELEKQLNGLSASFREQQQTLRIKLKDVQNGLREKEACVEFVKFNLYNKKKTDSVLYGAFVITKYDSAPDFVPLFEERQLQQIWTTSGTTNEQKVKNLYRGSTEGSDAGPEAAMGKKVYRLVWQPLEPYLKGITKIAYAPAGLLYKIAFHALPVDSATALMDKYTLRQYTSIREVALRSRTTGTQQPKQIVLFGNPDYARVNSSLITHNPQPVASSLYTPGTRGSYSNTWSPLSGTAEEIKKIKLLFEQNKIHATQFVQQEASEEHLKALSGQSPQVLHIATHGFFLPQAEQKRKEPGMLNENQYSFADNPLLRSGLVLAGANHAWSGNPPADGSEDGIVTAYEIAQLNLSNTELVVLSACETALGDIKGGEGVFGLQRAFKLAGVKKMIVSLWQVPDKETAELMTAFYNYWLKGQPIEQAFARAQSEMRKQYPAFYWAAFVLVE